MNRPFAVLLPAVAGLVALSCAQATPPPGGVEDRLPPRIIATTPDTLSIVESLDGPVVFRFNERISERGITDRSAMVSPRTGEVKVKRGRDEIRVEVEGGWKPGLVYRVLLLPGIRDMFGNELKEPAELVFSTGPDIAGAVLAGVVTERITGRPATRAFIEATYRPDSTTYVTAIDSSSFYAFRYLSPGLYELVAFTDQNRNGKRDPSEAASLPQLSSVNRDGDTVVVELAVVPADTTPPRMTRGEARDSQQVRLFTDDHLDPTAPIDLVRVVIRSLPDSVEIPGAHAVMTVDSFDVLTRAVEDTMPQDTMPQDSLPEGVLPQDSVPPDTAIAEAVSLGRPPPGVAQPGFGQPGGQTGVRTSEFGQPTGPLPFQEFVLVPAVPLVAGAQYLVGVEGLTNVSGRSNGGGEVEIEIPEPPPPPPDTAGVPPPDTSTVVRSARRSVP